MASDTFVARLNVQIGHEFAAHQQYLACDLLRRADHAPDGGALHRQVEERDHAMMMVKYLLDTDAEVAIPAIEGPRNTFEDIVAPVALALEQEKRVTGQVNELTAIARGTTTTPQTSSCSGSSRSRSRRSRRCPTSSRSSREPRTTSRRSRSTSPGSRRATSTTRPLHRSPAAERTEAARGAGPGRRGRSDRPHGRGEVGRGRPRGQLGRP